jgi:hypothetical protein
MPKKFALLLFLAGIGTAWADDSTPAAIAILEDFVDTEYVQAGFHRTFYEPRMRGVFLRYPDGWKAMCDENSFGNADNCPPERVAPFAKLFPARGEYRHGVSAAGLLKREWCCRDVGFLSLAKLPHDPVLKPEVFTNRQDALNDSETWKESMRSMSLSKDASRSIAAMVSGMDLCRVAGDVLLETRPPIALKWKDAHLRVTQRYVNRGGRSIARVDLSPAYWADCRKAGGGDGDAPILQPEFWVATSAGRVTTIHLFKSKGHAYAKLQLLEFGDFDGDGKTEALFFLSGYNDDGYVLLYEDMTRSAKFTWGYH